MYEIVFRTHGGTTTNSAHTWDDAVKEAARIVHDQTDQRWPQRVLANAFSQAPFVLHGYGRVNGTLKPIEYTVTITSDQPV